MDPVVFEDRPELDRPVLIAAFRGWNDAGESATAAATFLKDRWGGRVFGARFLDDLAPVLFAALGWAIGRGLLDRALQRRA